MNDWEYMRLALELAERGAGWTSPNPMVGAVIVKDGRIIGQGWHHRYGDLHAERDALANCTESPAGATLYVTLEPCPMCAGAIFNARIPKVVYGASDPKAGAYGSVFDLNSLPLNHKTAVEKGLLREESAALLSAFFKDLRKR